MGCMYSGRYFKLLKRGNITMHFTSGMHTIGLEVLHKWHAWHLRGPSNTKHVVYIAVAYVCVQ